MIPWVLLYNSLDFVELDHTIDCSHCLLGSDKCQACCQFEDYLECDKNEEVPHFYSIETVDSDDFINEDINSVDAIEVVESTNFVDFIDDVMKHPSKGHSFFQENS